MVDYREQLIDKIATSLFIEECLNVVDFESTDDLLDAVKEIITSELENVVLVRGQVLQ